MGLFGALFAGVSGLDSQSNKIGILSNNISNVNTVGFKQGQAAFNTLVVPSATTGTFSPGGVIGSNQQLISQQGIIAATTSPTDIAVSGGGMMFVSSAPVIAGQTVNPLYTRAGSFTQDANGNFLNSNGYFLLGLPIDASTGAPVANNVQNLVTVNVSSSATGSATPTSLITMAANFDANQTPLLGAGRNVQLTNSTNANNTGSEIIVGNDVADSDSTNKIVRGDTFTTVSTGTGVNKTDTFTYGGFTIGRSITIGYSTTAGGETEDVSGGGLGDGTNVLDEENDFTLTGTGSYTVQISVTNLAAYQPANTTYASLSGLTDADATALGLTSANQLNGEWKITATSGSSGSGTITLQLASGSTTTNSNTTTTSGDEVISNRTASFQGNILDASTETDALLGTNNPTSNFTIDALNLIVQVANVGTTTFKYSSSPDPTSGTFNSLNTLVAAINDATNSGLTARVTNGRLYIGATNPNNGVTFINGDATGDASTATPGQQLNGINWTQELDLVNTSTITPGNGTGQAYMFNSLSSLANAINTADPSNLTATLTNPTETAGLSINEANSQQTIDFTDGGSNTGSLLQAFGYKSQGNGLSGTFPVLTTGILAQTYNASSAQTDMSSGAVKPQFTKDITIYDSLGKSHTIAVNIAKLDTATATWAVELTAIPATDVSSLNSDGQIAAGTVTFNGNGKITSETGLGGRIQINWNQQTVGASPSQISLDLGLTSGSTNSGLTQAAGGFNVSVAQQNGAPTGELTGVSIDSNGFVIASFSNGQTQKMFQIPLANFTNPGGLEAISGNAYQETLASGTVNPELAGQSGVGTFTPSALEQSNVDLSTQLTDLIVAQQAYGANSKVLTIADQLLQQLDQIIQ